MAYTLAQIRAEIQDMLEDDNWSSGILDPEHTGSGLDDLSSSGQYTGSGQKRLYRVTVTATGATDTYKWEYSTDNGSTYTSGATGQSASTSETELEDGVKITFGAITGHTVDDYWVIQVFKPRYASRLTSMINDAQLEVAELIDIKRDLTSGTVSSTTSAYEYDYPSDFLKLSPSTYVNVTGYTAIPQATREYLNVLDEDHTDTTTSSSGPDLVSLEPTRLVVWPMWSGTLQVRDYYPKPTELSDETDTLDLVSDGVSGDRIAKNAVVAMVTARVLYDYIRKYEDARVMRSKAKVLLREIRSRYGRARENSFIANAYHHRYF